ncbi:unnamed protein product [Ilex paraguariensis]|uniref:Cytochrome P450 n=1 Tax=Ilex paraguariensis TaxID=185542 RepID=A0ABC8UX93_9AQUA
MGNLQNLYINDPEALKEMSTCTSPDFGRPSFQQKILEPLLGQGIVNSSGAIWAYQRKIIAPELYMDKIKLRAQLEPGETVQCGEDGNQQIAINQENNWGRSADAATEQERKAIGGTRTSIEHFEENLWRCSS